MQIRSEQAGDIDAIHAVHAASFPSDGEARLVDALRAANRLSISLVGLLEGEVIGHVAFSPVTSFGGEIGLGLAPVAVRSEVRRRGFAERLMRAGLRECEQIGCGFVVVLGDPEYYRRFGFAPASQWGLKDEYGGGDAFQAMAIGEGPMPGAGLVCYAPAFAGLDPEDA